MHGTFKMQHREHVGGSTGSSSSFHRRPSRGRRPIQSAVLLLGFLAVALGALYHRLFEGSLTSKTRAFTGLASCRQPQRLRSQAIISQKATHGFDWTSGRHTAGRPSVLERNKKFERDGYEIPKYDMNSKEVLDQEEFDELEELSFESMGLGNEDKNAARGDFDEDPDFDEEDEDRWDQVEPERIEATHGDQKVPYGQRPRQKAFDSKSEKSGNSDDYGLYDKSPDEVLEMQRRKRRNNSRKDRQQIVNPFGEAGGNLESSTIKTYPGFWDRRDLPRFDARQLEGAGTRDLSLEELEARVAAKLDGRKSRRPKEQAASKEVEDPEYDEDYDDDDDFDDSDTYEDDNAKFSRRLAGRRSSSLMRPRRKTLRSSMRVIPEEQLDEDEIAERRANEEHIAALEARLRESEASRRSAEAQLEAVNRKSPFQTSRNSVSDEVKAMLHTYQIDPSAGVRLQSLPERLQRDVLHYLRNKLDRKSDTPTHRLLLQIRRIESKMEPEEQRNYQQVVRSNFAQLEQSNKMRFSSRGDRIMKKGANNKPKALAEVQPMDVGSPEDEGPELNSVGSRLLKNNEDWLMPKQVKPKIFEQDQKKEKKDAPLNAVATKNRFGADGTFSGKMYKAALRYYGPLPWDRVEGSVSWSDPSNMTWQDLGLVGKQFQKVDDLMQKYGVMGPNRMQEEAVQEVLTGRDLLMTSPTGSGKTLAFLLPLLQKHVLSINPDMIRPIADEKFFSRGRSKLTLPRLLIVAPGRELAKQIWRVVIDLLTPFPEHNCTLLVGQDHNKFQDEVMRRTHPLVIVGTPGKILDHVMEGRLVLEDLDAVVMDEVDALLSMSRQDHVKLLLDFFTSGGGHGKPEQVQRVLVSASGVATSETRSFAEEVLGTDDFPIVGPKSGITLPSKVLHIANGAPDVTKKTLFMKRLWKSQPPPDGVMVFCNNHERVHKVWKELRQMGMSAEYLTGNRSKEERDKAVMRLAEGKVDYLVATDAAMRGLDFRDISHIVNFEIPDNAAVYAHRAGRAGRQGATGIVISLAQGGANNNRLKSYARDLDFELFEGNVDGGELGVDMARSYTRNVQDVGWKRQGEEWVPKGNQSQTSDRKENVQFDGQKRAAQRRWRAKKPKHRSTAEHLEEVGNG